MIEFSPGMIYFLVALSILIEADDDKLADQTDKQIVGSGLDHEAKFVGMQ